MQQERFEKKSLKEKEAKLLGGLLYAQVSKFILSQIVPKPMLFGIWDFVYIENLLKEELIGRLGDKSNSASSKSSSDSGFSSIR